MSFGKKERFSARRLLAREWLFDCEMILPLLWGEDRGKGECRTQSELHA
jgi:hypothetical protein